MSLQLWKKIWARVGSAQSKRRKKPVLKEQKLVSESLNGSKGEIDTKIKKTNPKVVSRFNLRG